MEMNTMSTSNSFENKRVYIYARVSTSRQEKSDLSIPDQINTAERWIEDQSAVKVRVFSESGIATDDTRRAFKEMIKLAESNDRPVDVILAYSMSRLFRNAADFMQYRNRLRRLKIRLVSITQNLGDDPAADMAMGMLALSDEYNSKENAKHVRRAMLANAANGFWNGQTPPFGFRTYAMPQSRGKDRKKLEHDPEAAEVVRYAVRTYLKGDIGLTLLAEHFNKRGDRIRCNRFSVSNIHNILTNTALIGYVMFNRRDSQTGELRPESEWISIPVPPIISEEDFYAVRKLMADRDPGLGEGALKTNTNLLTGRAKCGCDGDGFGAGMMTSTGKSGQYRYYACSARVKQGAEACVGRRIPMNQLDDMVVDAVAKQLVEPKRLSTLLQTWLDRSETAVAQREKELKALRARLTRLEGESARVIKLVRNEICSPDDPEIASELSNIRAQKVSAKADIAVLERQLDSGDRKITPAIISEFGELLRRKLRGPDPKLQKAYVHLLVDKVEVGNRTVRISGRNAMLERAIMASRLPGAMVPKAERKWCTRSDSNARPPDS
jgi:site-specific DNA recombinase